MNKKIKSLMLAGVMCIGMLGLVACDEVSTSSNESSKSEQMDLDYNTIGTESRQTEKNQRKLEKTQPAPQIDYSVERANLQERINRWNDPNKISYIYLLSDTGTCISYMPIKGKVSSVNSKLTTEDQIVYNYYRDNTQVVNSPDLDGSYGSNGDAIFFFTTKGEYVEWNGKYFLSDEPIRLTQEPLMVYDGE